MKYADDSAEAGSKLSKLGQTLSRLSAELGQRSSRLMRQLRRQIDSMETLAAGSDLRIYQKARTQLYEALAEAERLRELPANVAELLKTKLDEFETLRIRKLALGKKYALRFVEGGTGLATKAKTNIYESVEAMVGKKRGLPGSGEDLLTKRGPGKNNIAPCLFGAANPFYAAFLADGDARASNLLQGASFVGGVRRPSSRRARSRVYGAGGVCQSAAMKQVGEVPADVAGIIESAGSLDTMTGMSFYNRWREGVKPPRFDSAEDISIMRSVVDLHLNPNEFGVQWPKFKKVKNPGKNAARYEIDVEATRAAVDKLPNLGTGKYSAQEADMSRIKPGQIVNKAREAAEEVQRNPLAKSLFEEAAEMRASGIPQNMADDLERSLQQNLDDLKNPKPKPDEPVTRKPDDADAPRQQPDEAAGKPPDEAAGKQPDEAAGKPVAEKETFGDAVEKVQERIHDAASGKKRDKVWNFFAGMFRKETPFILLGTAVINEYRKQQSGCFLQRFKEDDLVSKTKVCANLTYGDEPWSFWPNEKVVEGCKCELDTSGWDGIPYLRDTVKCNERQLKFSWCDPDPTKGGKGSVDGVSWDLKWQKYGFNEAFRDLGHGLQGLSKMFTMFVQLCTMVLGGGVTTVVGLVGLWLLYHFSQVIRGMLPSWPYGSQPAVADASEQALPASALQAQQAQQLLLQNALLQTAMAAPAALPAK